MNNAEQRESTVKPAPSADLCGNTPFGWDSYALAVPKYLIGVLIIAKLSLVWAYFSVYCKTNLRISSASFEAAPTLTLCSKIIFFLLVMRLLREMWREEIKPSTAIIINAAYLLLVVTFVTLQMGNERMHFLTSWLSDKISLDDFLSFFFLQFADPPYLGIIVVSHLLLLPLLYRHSRILTILPLISWFAMELCGKSPWIDHHALATFHLCILPLGLICSFMRLPTLRIIWQIAPQFLLILPLLAGVPFSKNIELFLQMVLFVSIIFAGISYLLSGFKGYPIISWILPCLLMSVIFHMPEFIFSMLNYSLLSYCIPGYLFQELLISGFTVWLIGTWFSKAGTGSRWTSPVGYTLCGFFAAYVMACVVETRIFQLLGVRWTFAVFQLAGGDLLIARGSILPYISPFIIFCLVFIFAMGWLDVRSISGKTAVRLPLILLLMCAFWHFVALVNDFEPAHSLLYSFVRSLPIREHFLQNFAPETVLKQLSAIQLFPENIQKTEKPAGKNLILIVAESMHTRYLSLCGFPQVTQPRLSKYRDHLKVFPGIFCSYPSSENAYFSVYNGLRSSDALVTELNIGLSCPSLFKLLRNNGYRTSYFYSGNKGYRRFGSWLELQGFDDLYDMTNMPFRDKYQQHSWGVNEQAVRDAIIQQIHGYREKGERFSLTYCCLTPHNPFALIDPEFRVFIPTQADVEAGLDIKYRYMNQILFMDSILGDLMDCLKRENLLKDTIVAIVGDHGEALNEDGIVGHGFTCTPGLMNVFFAIYDERFTGFARDMTIGYQPDILPTLLDLLNIPVPTGHLYQGNSLMSPSRADHFFISSLGDSARVGSGTFHQIKKDSVEKYSFQPASDGSHYEFFDQGEETDRSLSNKFRSDALALKDLQTLFLQDYEAIRAYHISEHR
ncbi:MAG: sulfatase-like hydrolase/transferase [Candidatus Riflebacteria bacterium]|nr:sulfatase-like hydrolase/transferase [Candidatus Riflebacteria bacterium]